LLRWSAIATAALLGISLVSVPASEAGVATAVGAPSVNWAACSTPELAYSGLECGTLAVPLDHSNPAGATIKLALTRKLHTATYKGVLLVNPGGPGGSGLTLPGLSDYVPGNVGASYDWIGFDPRGVGASRPSLHCTRSYFGYDRPSYLPRSPSIRRYWLSKSRTYSAVCAKTPAQRALLPHLTTLDTVRDMDAIREALGAEEISYYGFSYGTYLGQVYATRYPTRVGRFVLDGVVDPARVWYAANLDQDRAFDANMDVYWRYLAAHPRTFHLGQKWPAVKSGYYRTLRRLDRKPAVRGRLGPDELADTMLGAGYYVHDWVDLGLEYSRLVRRGLGAGILNRYTESQVGDDNGFAIYNAVQCTDAPWPGRTRTLHDAWSVHRRTPFLTWSNTWYNAPCLSWHAPRHAKARVSGTGVTAKMLLISETRDAATPYSGGVSCVDNSVADYLRTGIVPRRVSGTRADRSCPRLAPPVPGTVGGRGPAAPVDRMSPMLRRDLVAAQRHTLR